MNKPVSQPSVPAQPQADRYAVAELALFRPFTRDTYRAAFGVEPPPYNPSRLIKNWFDSTADTFAEGNVAIYRVLGHDAKGMPVLRQLVIASVEASSVNLPGVVEYPRYVIAPTKATFTGAPLNPLFLSLETQARSLMRELGGQDLKDGGADDVFPTLYPPDEPRRMWMFQYKGSFINAGNTLYAQNVGGVGAPGKWDLAREAIAWVAEPAGPTGFDDLRPPRDMPLRELLGNERFQTGLMQEVMIARTDTAREDAGGFTAEDRATLRTIHQIVTRLAG